MPRAWGINNHKMGVFVRWLQRTFGMAKKTCPVEQECLELLRLMLDEQATEEESKYVHEHIDKCYRCYENYDLENTIREAVKNKVKNLKVPPELVTEIKNKIYL